MVSAVYWFRKSHAPYHRSFRIVSIGVPCRTGLAQMRRISALFSQNFCQGGRYGLPAHLHTLVALKSSVGSSLTHLSSLLLHVQVRLGPLDGPPTNRRCSDRLPQSHPTRLRPLLRRWIRILKPQEPSPQRHWQEYVNGSSIRRVLSYSRLRQD